MDRNAISRNISTRMHAAGLSRKELAIAIDIEEMTMERWLAGTRQPTVYGLWRISKVFGCTMDDLVEGIEG